MPDSHRGSSIRRWLRAAATERLAYKGSALFFATVLWLVVSAEEPSEQLVPVRLDLTHDSSRTLVQRGVSLRGLAVGRARELIKLYNAPLVIRRVIPSDWPDTVRP